MDSFFDISWQVSEPEYRKGKGYSYSTLSRFNNEGFNNLSKLFDKIETPSLTFGSMVDTLLTGSKEEFDSLFLVCDMPKISDTLKNLCSVVYTTTFANSLEEVDTNTLVKVSEMMSFYLHWKPETRVNFIKKEGEAYFKLLSLSGDKKIVSTLEYQEALDCCHALKTSKATKVCFEPNNPFDTSFERFYQLKFQGEYEDIPLRCMADLITVDHKNKVVRPYDLKTSSKAEWDFYKSFLTYGYWIQAQLYWYIIRQNMDKHPIYKDYKLDNYTFIVISKYTKVPLLWEYPDTIIESDIEYKDFKCRNWRNIVKELHYYMNNNVVVPKGITLDEPNNIVEYLTK